MKFRMVLDVNKIKLKREWYRLCICINCQQVHAYSVIWRAKVYDPLCKVDLLINCCKEPNNWFHGSSSEKKIGKFVREWQDVN